MRLKNNTDISFTVSEMPYNDDTHMNGTTLDIDHSPLRDNSASPQKYHSKPF